MRRVTMLKSRLKASMRSLNCLPISSSSYKRGDNKCLVSPYTIQVVNGQIARITKELTGRRTPDPSDRAEMRVRVFEPLLYDVVHLGCVAGPPSKILWSKVTPTSMTLAGTISPFSITGRSSTAPSAINNALDCTGQVAPMRLAVRSSQRW